MARNTTEQQAVIDSEADLLAVDAFAGTGKTSTLVEYTLARPRERILYIAFNKSVATEAKERFPDNVDCRTTHSLAYGAVGKKYSQKLGNVPVYAVTSAFNCQPKRAKDALSTLNSWLCSIDDEISNDHVDKSEVLDQDEEELVVELARRIWSRMKDLTSDMKMPHDGYLKLWAMQEPLLRYDIILLDEAQDTNPITLDLVMAQQRHAKIVLVGDRHQGIYGFRKAMNAMEAVNAQERVALTQSFRFGQAIADVATLLLQYFKDESQTVKGRSDINVQWKVDRSKHYAIIGRTNAGLFSAAAHVILAGKNKRMHFVGGFDSYLFGKVLDAYYLWSGERSRIKDQSISRFPSFTEFARYGEEAGDAEVKALVRTVEQYRSEVPRIYNAMRAAEVPEADMSDLTLTTGHRAKGLEWNQVELCGDFIELPPPEEFDVEEVNLLYVALTRAIRAIALPISLQEWLESVGYEFEGLVEAESSEPVTVAGADKEPLNDRDVLATAITEAARAAGLYGMKEVPSTEQLVHLCSLLGQRKGREESRVSVRHHGVVHT